jgi:type 2 lantibiotic biosynthesis protein LanM
VLYDGVGGIAFFLAYLAHETGNATFEDLAHAALETACRRMPSDIAEGLGIGAFSGRASLAYVIMHLAHLWREPSLLDKAVQIASGLADGIAADRQFDIMDGVAGCGLVLLGLFRATGAQKLMTLARACGERLVEGAVHVGPGVGWTGTPGSKPLLGFSHGAAGIAFALVELAVALADDRFRALAAESLAYERGLFAPDQGNWPDLRPNDGSEMNRRQFRTHWCHGAPGIGLARLGLVRNMGDDPMLHEEIRVALATTQREGFGGDHCLCHGDLGNCDLLLHAASVFGKADWLIEARRRGTAVIHDHEEHGSWRCGTPLAVTTPGLMTGLAGIGFGLLRLFAPERIPSVLTLQSPSADTLSPA